MTNKIRQFKKQDLEIAQEEIGYKGFFTIKKYQLRFRQFLGSFSEFVNRELMEKIGAVGILLFDPTTQQVVLIEQFRPGAMNDPVSPWQIEIVAGLMEANEEEAAVAIRETEEETGLEVEELIPMLRYWVSPGSTNEHMTLFCGKVNAKNAGGIYGLATEGEDIKVHVVDVETAFAWIDQGLINNAPAIIALQWLRNKDKVFN